MSDEKDQDINYEEENNESSTVDIKDKLEKLKEKLELCREEKQNYLTGWQREKADFINYKRRQEEQMVEWGKMFGDGLIKEILPVLDTLDASIAHSGGNGGAFSMIRDQLMKVLVKHGLMEIKSVGEKFNHEMHEAVEQVEIDGEDEGEVVEEAQKGYLLNGKVIRTAKVKVSK